MSSPVHIDIDHLATLSRLALTPEEKAKFSAQLGDILGHIEQLKQVNVDGVEPTAHATPIFNVLQSDEARPGLPVEQALRNELREREVVALLTQVLVDSDDPGFEAPSKPIGPVYDEASAREVVHERGWVVRRDGDGWKVTEVVVHQTRQVRDRPRRPAQE